MSWSNALASTTKGRQICFASLAGWALAAITCVVAMAQPAQDCQSFAWPLERERAWFSAPNLPAVASGAKAELRALALKLRPMAEVEFAETPERAPRSPATFGATIDMAAPKPGLYQITLSDEAWIDVVQAGARLKSSAHSSSKGCSGLRKSVRFELGPEPFVVQISGASVDRLNLAIAPADE